MATASKVRLRFRIATTRIIRPGFWMGNPLTNTAEPVTDHAAIVAAIRTSIASSGFMAGFDDDLALEEVEIQNFTRRPADGDHPDPWWEALTTTTESSGADLPGTQTSQSLPPQSATVLSLLSTTPGPSGRNRMYLPPVSEADADGTGLISSARVTQLQDDINAFLIAAAGVGSGFGAVVASATDDELYPVVSTAVRNIVRSQRRRQARVT